MSEKNQIIQLCSDEFLVNFSKDFFDRFSLIPWKKEFGPKDKLHFCHSNIVAGVIVASDFSYSQQNITSWLRVITKNGLLILERNSYMDHQSILSICPDNLEYIPNENCNVWIFRKIDSYLISDIHSQILYGYRNKLSGNEMLKLMNELESKYSHCVELNSIFLTRLNIYKKYNLSALAREECQKRIDMNLYPNNRMGAILLKIAFSDEFYQSGFRDRKLMLDRTTHTRTPKPPKQELQDKRWNGEDVQNKVIVMWTEFGLGDEIMFSQLAYYFKCQGAKKVIAIVQPAIVDLIRSSLDIDQVISSENIEAELERFDYWTYPHDILAYIYTPFSKVPKRSPYLSVPTEKKETYRDLFAKNQHLNIGIVWRGNRTHENDTFRSIHELKYIEELFKIDNINWYCFQKDCNEEEIALLKKFNVPHITKDFNNLEETAVALTHVDYLISVDTSVVHVAGAIGLPTFVLLPYFIDWRWGLNTKTNYWYPNMTSIRCQTPEETGQWNSVIEELKQYIDQIIKQKKIVDYIT